MEPFDLRRWKGFQKAGGNPNQPPWIDHLTIDSRSVQKGSLFVALSGNRADGHRYISEAESLGATFALVKKDYQTSSKISLLHVDDPLTAFQEIVQAYRETFSLRMIAIAGSYGKTMVKDLLHAFLETTFSTISSPESFNSQIGVPLSLLQIKKHHQIALIEAGFSHPGEAGRLSQMIQPEATLLTHLGKKHSTTLGSLEKTAQEMVSLFPKSGWVIAPKHPLLAPHLPNETFYWNEHNPKFPKAKILPDGLHYQIDFPDKFSDQFPIKMGCNYFLDLIHLAIKPAYLLGVSPQKIVDVLKRYVPEPMRTEILPLPTGATVINETYGSDPQSIDLALRQFSKGSKGQTYFLFGGLRKNDSMAYNRAGQMIGEAQLDHLSLYGFSSPESFLEKVQILSPKTSVTHFNTLEEAIAHHHTFIKSGDQILIKGAYKPSFEKINEAFQGSIATNQCFIHLGAIAANLKLLRKRLPINTRIMVMVKALAYGTSDTHMAQFLAQQGIDILGVSYIDEAIALRRNGIKQTLFVLNAAPYEVEKAVQGGFEIGVSNSQMITLLGKGAQKAGKRLSLHLHVDTGMSRLGCRPEEALELAQKIVQSPSLILKGVMTHFACADRENEDPFTKKQISKFDQVIELIEKAGISIPWKHAANSSGTLRFSFPRYNMVRVGMGIYGLLKEEGVPAVSLLSRVAGINWCKKGETIGYGRNYSVEKDWQKIAVIPLGYFDGIHLHYSGKGQVMIRGKKAPMVGTICMDYLMVDTTHIPEVNVGDPVLFFGEDEEGHFACPKEFAEQGGSSVYELMTCLGPRIQRVFIQEEDHRVC